MIRIDTDSAIPPFEQLRAQLNLQVVSGRLGPGDRLPPIRQLAAQLELSNGTVARAYRELEYSGVIVGRGRKGTFVADSPPTAPGPAEIAHRLRVLAETLVFNAEQLGADTDSIRRAVDDALER